MKRAAVTLLLCSATTFAAAQTVYRCGPDGREYSHAPCPGGKAVEADDSRTAAERDAARKVAREDERLAGQLARERRARDADAVPTAGGFETAPKPAAPASAPKASKKKSKKKPVYAAPPA